MKRDLIRYWLGLISEVMQVLMLPLAGAPRGGPVVRVKAWLRFR